MNLPHGKNNSGSRIVIRAEAIYRGVYWGDQPDPDDINLDEEREIARAKELAEKWWGLIEQEAKAVRTAGEKFDNAFEGGQWE